MRYGRSTKKSRLKRDASDKSSKGQIKGGCEFKKGRSKGDKIPREIKEIG